MPQTAMKVLESYLEKSNKRSLRKTFHNNEWWFAVEDVVNGFMDSDDFHENLRKIKARDRMLEQEWGRIVAPVSVKTPEGKKLFDCVTLEGAFRIIQAIPSPKAEPVRRWLAKTAFKRLNKMQKRESAKTDMNQVFEMLAEISTPEIAGKTRKALEKRVKKPIGVSTYKISSSLPKNLKQELPTPEQVGKLLESL